MKLSDGLWEFLPRMLLLHHNDGRAEVKARENTYGIRGIRLVSEGVAYPVYAGVVADDEIGFRFKLPPCSSGLDAAPLFKEAREAHLKYKDTIKAEQETYKRLAAEAAAQDPWKNGTNREKMQEQGKPIPKNGDTDAKVIGSMGNSFLRRANKKR